jgi:PAS domain S-box-containing protein
MRKLNIRLLVGLAIGFVVVNAIVAELLGLALQQSRDVYERDAELTTQTVALSLQQNIGGALDKIDLALLALSDELVRQKAAGSMDAGSLGACIDRQVDRVSDLDIIQVVDAQGNIVYGASDVDGERVNIADRDYFVQLRNASNDLFVISKPLVGRVDKKWMLVVARRLQQPDGTFGGVVQGIIALERLNKRLTAINLGENGVVTIRDENMAFILRYPDPVGMGSVIGNKAVSKGLQALLDEGRTFGTCISVSPFDGIERKTTLSKVSKYPLYVTMGLATQDYLAKWHAEVQQMVSVALSFFLAMLAICLVIYQNWQRKIAAYRAVRREKETAQRYLDIAGVMLGTLDKDGIITLINRKGSRILGYGEKELVGRNWFEICVPAAARDERKKLFARMLAGEIPDGNAFELPVRVKDGTERIVRFHNTVLHDGSGSISGILLSGEDITEQRHAEKELYKRMEMLAVLNQASSRFIALALIEITHAIQALMDAIGRMLAVDRVYVFRFSTDRTVISNTHEWCAEGVASQIADLQKIPCGQLPWWVERISHAEGINFPSLAAMPPEAAAERALLEKHGVRSVLVVPIVWSNGVEGFVGFDSVAAERVWSDEEQSTLETLANLLSQALKRKESEDALVSAHDQLQRFLEASPVMIYSCKVAEAFQPTFISSNIKTLMGYEVAEFLAPGFWASHIHPQDAPRVVAEMARLLKQGRLYHEYRFRHRDGSWRWMSDEMKVINGWNDQPEKVFGYWRDITDRRPVGENQEEAV